MESAEHRELSAMIGRLLEAAQDGLSRAAVERMAELADSLERERGAARGDGRAAGRREGYEEGYGRGFEDGEASGMGEALAMIERRLAARDPSGSSQKTSKGV